jgi:hypothetical protein
MPTNAIINAVPAVARFAPNVVPDDPILRDAIEAEINRTI